MTGKSTELKRGFCLRCPACGQGRIFCAYLKQNDICPVCGEELGSLRADDGPAWITILIVGHIVGTLALSLVTRGTFPDGVILAGSILLSILLALVILPRAKGVFIAILWRMRRDRVAERLNDIKPD